MMNFKLPTMMIAAWTLLTPAFAHAYYSNTITIDGNTSDWFGVPAVDIDPIDNIFGVDIANTFIANDENYLYIRNAFHTASTVSTYIAIDTDSNSATGFDIYGLGAVGSEVGFQNDFPFVQGTGVFNTGGTLTGDFFGIGAALLATAPGGDDRELAISLSSLYTGGGPVFTSDTFRILIWTDNGFDVSAAIPYTLSAAVPEPSSLTLLLVTGTLAGIRFRNQIRKGSSIVLA